MQYCRLLGSPEISISENPWQASMQTLISRPFVPLTLTKSIFLENDLYVFFLRVDEIPSMDPRQCQGTVLVRFTYT